MADISKNHGYHLAALQQACYDEDIELMEQQLDTQKDNSQVDRHHTPMKSSNPKKMKANQSQTQNEVSNSVLLDAIQKLVCKFDTQSEHLKGYEFQLQKSTDALRKVKESEKHWKTPFFQLSTCHVFWSDIHSWISLKIYNVPSFYT